MEGLGCLAEEVKQGGYILGFKLSSKGGKGKEVSYLLFVDNTLVICEVNQDQIGYLSGVKPYQG